MSVVRVMTRDDVEHYAAIRREMLQDSPWSFVSSPEDDVASSAEAVLAWFGEDDSEVVLVEDPDDASRIVSVVGVRRERKAKYRHRATIWGVYTTPRMRGRGLARLAMNRAMEIARSWDGVDVLQLGVSSNAPAAKGLYESMGFVEWGVEPDCVRVDGAAYDEHHMSMRL
ncbi:MAG: GNAT family protein [Phycisphaerales bacterium]